MHSLSCRIGSALPEAKVAESARNKLALAVTAAAGYIVRTALFISIGDGAALTWRSADSNWALINTMALTFIVSVVLR